MRSILFAFFLLIQSQSVFAGTYWVHPYGTAASYAACESATDPGGICVEGNCAGYCAYDQANYNVQPDDVVYLKSGTYIKSGGNDYQYGIVAPRVGGTQSGGACTSKITYQNAPGETVTIIGSGTGMKCIYLTGVSCIKVAGITCQDTPDYAVLISSHYNEISNNIFTSSITEGEVGYSGGSIHLNSSCSPNYDCWNTNNWIHHNTIEKKRNGETCGEGIDLIRIGDDDSERDGADMTAANNYNTIENNVIAYASHSCIDNYGNNNVIRNNYFHNEPWWDGNDSTCNYPNDTYTNTDYNGKYGHRTFQITDGYDRDGTFSIIEGNRFGFGSTNPGNNGADGMDIAAPRNIVRYNSVFGAMNSCVMFKYGWAYTGNGGTYNRFYNNTMFHCGYGNPFYELELAECEAAGGKNCSTTPQALLAVRWYVDETVGNVLKNNLIYDSRRYALSSYDIGYGANSSSSPDGTVLSHNWLTSFGDPSFVNPSLSDATSTTLPDLSLQSASSAIDGNTTSLTLASGAGDNNATLHVDDALYFQDGTWGSSLSDIQADWIAIGTVSNVVQISSIDYATNTITLASAMTWADDAPIWLYKKSDGTRVLYGSAPDYGAYEYDSTPVGQVTGSFGGNLH